MKIMQIAQKPQRRGAEMFALQLSQALRRQGHDARMIYLYPHTAEKPLPLCQDDLVLAGKEVHFAERIPGVHPGLLRRLIVGIRCFRPDIVQVNGGRTVKYGAFAKRFEARKEWALIYKNIDDPTYWVRDPVRFLFYRRLVMPQVDAVVGVSSVTLNSVKKLYGLNIPSIHIPNGRDPAQFEGPSSQAAVRQELGVGPEVAIVLFIGRLTRQKRPDRFLRIVGRIRERVPDVEAWIVGDGPLRESLKCEAQSLGIQHIVRFWGSQEQVAPYIVASDLLLLTSDSEGAPGVVIEAGFLGKPAVATRVGGTSDCVLDGETAILVDPQNEEGLVQAVSKLLQNPRQQASMGLRAYEWTRANFTIDRVAHQYLDFYQKVLARVRR